jgi:polyphosphate kinase
MTQKKRKADRAAAAALAEFAVAADAVEFVSAESGPAVTSRGSLGSAVDGEPGPAADGRDLHAGGGVLRSLDLPPLDPDLYLNRELSWLDFNRRVLEEAEEPAPLLERVKFAAIFSSNMDEWFMIRVAGLKRKLAAGISDPGLDGRTPAAQYGLVRRTAQELMDRHAALVHKVLLPALTKEGIAIVPFESLTAGERASLAAVFEREIFPVLTPQAVDRGRPFPHVSSRSLNLIVVLRSRTVGSRFARVKIPATLPRFVAVPGDDPRALVDGLRFTWLEEVVAAHLPRLFSGNDILAWYPFHITRDADIELVDDEDDAHDLLSAMSETLGQRTFGPVVRLMIDQSIPDEVRDWLVDQLHATERELYIVDGRMALEDLWELYRLDRPGLKDAPFVPKPLFTPARPVLGLPIRSLDDPLVPQEPDIFSRLRGGDILIHHPYQSFNAVVDFIRAASEDPDVVAIKQTLYRLGNDSPLIPALINARDDDTQVAVLVEVKARFDEENNITWAKQMERKGVHVAYGLAGLKTHCKATLVVRRERDGLRRYVHLATGNYNASTARIYEDFGLLTAREDIGNDVSELFNVLTGFAHQEAYRTLWVAPDLLRQHFLSAIAAEIEGHRRTGRGHLIFKMNSLQDPTMIQALYAAARAGVKVDLIVRGICCLRPGVPGWSETVRVISVVGRFLEHSRIYWFRHGGNGGDQDRVYLGSADLMQRNLDRRVEVIFPVEAEPFASHLRDVILPAYLRDNVNARELGPDGEWHRVVPKRGKKPFDVQSWLLTQY